MYFCNFVIISSWKRAEPFILTNLNPTYPRILCANFGWNSPSGSGEDDFLNSSIYFHNNLPLEKCRTLHLNKLEFASPKDDLCQVWLKMWKVYHNNDDGDGQRTKFDRKSHLSLRLRWAKMYKITKSWYSFCFKLK